MLAASCTMDLAGLPASSSTSASAASGGGSTSASSTTGGSGGAAGVSTSSSGSSSSAGSSSSGAGGSGTGGGDAGPPIIVAGELLVDLDVNDVTAGTPSWDNKGTLNGVFTVRGSPKKELNGGRYAILFNGNGDAYLGPASVPTIEENDDRSIELWVLNSKIDPLEETMVSWSNRKPFEMGTMMSFNYGNSPGFGAVTHWDAPDLPWGSSSNAAPMGNEWHHVAYTYDGTTATVFADGAKKNEKAVTLDTKKNFSINLAVQREDKAFKLYGSLAIAVVRIHSKALTANDVQANYLAEKSRFQ